MPLVIRSDSHGVLDKYKAKILEDDDIRSFRRWAWLIANEPGFDLEFFPGDLNNGADLLNRPSIRVQGQGKTSLCIDDHDV